MPEISPDDHPVAQSVNTELPENGDASTSGQDSSSTTISDGVASPVDSYGVMKPYQVTMFSPCPTISFGGVPLTRVYSDGRSHPYWLDDWRWKCFARVRAWLSIWTMELLVLTISQVRGQSPSQRRRPSVVDC